MLHKSPKSSKGGLFKGGLKLFVAIEVTGFIGAFIAWQQLKSSRDFRFTLYKKFPSLLDKFYSFEEYTTPTNNIRILDQQIWEKERKLAQ